MRVENRKSSSAASEEQDARQRILNAALTEFGQHGFRGASIRRIARLAGVSPALIQYHFGTKEGLRTACDTWALGWLDSHWIEGLEHGRYSDPAYLSGAMSSAEPILGYLVTAFASNSSVASTWYDRVRHRMRDILHDGLIGPPVTEEDDIDAVSAVMAAMALGITLFYKEIARVLETEDLPEQTMLRVGRARLLLAPERIVGPEFREQSRAGIDAYAEAIDAASSDDTANSDDSTSSPLHQQRKAQA